MSYQKWSLYQVLEVLYLEYIFKLPFLSQFGIDTESVAAKYIYLQFEIIQNYRCSVKVGWTVD